MKNILEAFKPVTDAQLLFTRSTMSRKLHPIVSVFLRILIAHDFPHLVAECTTIPSTDCILFAVQSTDLRSDCWRFDWTSVPTAIHGEIFLRFSLPAFVSAHPLSGRIPPSLMISHFLVSFAAGQSSLPGFP
jgi:hypothetical protein